VYPWLHLLRANPTRSQVDRRFVAEPGAQAFGRGLRRSHLAWWMGDLYGPLDPIGKGHESLQ
jgi:hypothetical protein